MSLYRDPEFFELENFLKHIAIAETLLAVNADLATRLSAEHHPEVERSYWQSWRDAWEQLRQARAIAARLGRDVTRIDAAHARAGDADLVAAAHSPITRDMRVAAKATVIALRRAVPESAIAESSTAVASVSAEAETQRPRVSLVSPMVRLRIGMFIVVVIAALLKWQC